MRDALALCRELQVIQSVIGLAGNPPQPLQAANRRPVYWRQPRSILQHLETAERATSAAELRDPAPRRNRIPAGQHQTSRLRHRQMHRMGLP